MRKGKKILIGSAAIAGAGLLLIAVGIGMGGRVSGFSLDRDGLHVIGAENGSKTKEPSYQEKEEELEKFSDMDIELEYIDIRIEPSDHYGISYKLNRDYKFDYKVENGRLKVSQKYPSKSRYSVQWFYIGSLGNKMWDSGSEYITLFVPEGAEFGDIRVSSESGDISAESLRADSLDLLAKYGDITLENVESASINLELDSGAVKIDQMEGDNLTLTNEYGESTLKETTISGNTKIQIDSGDLKLENCFLGSMKAENEYGNFLGENLKVSDANITMDSGECRISSLEAENIDINSEYGNVILNLAHPIEKYYYNLCTEYGKIMVGEKDFGERYQSMEQKENQIQIKCDSGDIEIY